MHLPSFRGFRPLSRWITPAKLTALFLLIIGAKLCVMRSCSTPLPFFDQWYGEGVNVVQRSLHGTLGWRDLLAPNNQHRILWTRLLVLGLFRLNGQWDTQVEMIAAAALHAVGAVALGAILIRRLGRDHEDKILCCLAFLFMLPFSWENTLSGGFQSQYYFLILFSVLALWGLALHRPWCIPWWVGVVSGVLAWFTVASGWFAAFEVAVWAGFRWWRGGNRARADAVTSGAAALVTLGGVSLLFGIDAVIGNSHADSIWEFLWKLCGLLAWPNQTPWALVVAYAPVGWVIWCRVRGVRRDSLAGDDFVLLLAGWVVMQTAALAFARNHYRGLDVSRYMDVQSLGALANFACLLNLARVPRNTLEGSGRARAGLRSMQVGWVALTILGLHHLTERSLQPKLPFTAKNYATEERIVADFVAAPTPHLLATKRWFELQSDDIRLVINLLGDPAVRAVLPSPVQPPLPLVPAQVAGNAHPASPGERSDLGADGQGWVLTAPPAGQPFSVFRSGTMHATLPWLQIAVAGSVGSGAQVGLVGERTGEVTPLLSDDETDTLRVERVPTPAEPFHVVARVEPGNPSGLTFFEPREIGPLSVWVSPLFNTATGWLFAGALLWMGAAAGRRWLASEPVPSGEPARDVSRAL